MAKSLVVIRYRDADGSAKTYSIPTPDINPEAFDEEVGNAADVLISDGICHKNEDGHYVLIPAHAIHRVDFHLEPDAEEKPGA
ncbi:hypothetical protein ACWDWS_02235 [Streptomyces sp. NPDC003328]